MKTKQEQIEDFLLEPIKVGDKVYVRGLGIQDKQSFGHVAKVESVKDDETIFIKSFKSLMEVKKGDYKKCTNEIGHNPFPEKRWNEGIRMVQFCLESIINSVYDVRKKTYRYEIISEVSVPELEWNPFFINNNGEEIVYQRDFCWNLRDKQLLIDSIYNGIDIGKIIIRKRSWDWVLGRIKEDKSAALKDIVDGKQRLKSIIEFINNEYPDSYGFYWDDLSKKAQNTFLNFNSVSYGEIEEKAKDEDVKNIFLNINFSGVAMSQEHIDFVRNINI